MVVAGVAAAEGFGGCGEPVVDGCGEHGGEQVGDFAHAVAEFVEAHVSVLAGGLVAFLKACGVELFGGAACDAAQLAWGEVGGVFERGFFVAGAARGVGEREPVFGDDARVAEGDGAVLEGGDRGRVPFGEGDGFVELRRHGAVGDAAGDSEFGGEGTPGVVGFGCGGVQWQFCLRELPQLGEFGEFAGGKTRLSAADARDSLDARGNSVALGLFAEDARQGALEGVGVWVDQPGERLCFHGSTEPGTTDIGAGVLCVSMSPSPVLRLGADDSGILSQATLENLNWSGLRFSADDVVSRPEFAHYTRLLPGRGDVGFWLARDDGEWMSVVWLLFLPAHDPGYGFVREGVPELSVCTRQGARGRGHGRRLVLHALSEARARGVGAVSLSVEPNNPAVRLYESLGFVPVPGKADGTMLVEL